jgi:hypothetical protein
VYEFYLGYLLTCEVCGAQDAECVILFRVAANALRSRKYEAVSRNATSKTNTEFCYGMDARTFMDLIAPSIFDKDNEDEAGGERTTTQGLTARAPLDLGLRRASE